MSKRHYFYNRSVKKVEIMVNNTIYPSDLADKFMLRLPDGMRSLIKEQAAGNGRSMNAEIVFRLKQAYEKIMKEKP